MNHCSRACLRQQGIIIIAIARVARTSAGSALQLSGSLLVIKNPTVRSVLAFPCAAVSAPPASAHITYKRNMTPAKSVPPATAADEALPTRIIGDLAAHGGPLAAPAQAGIGKLPHVSRCFCMAKNLPTHPAGKPNEISSAEALARRHPGSVRYAGPSVPSRYPVRPRPSAPAGGVRLSILWRCRRRVFH